MLSDLPPDLLECVAKLLDARSRAALACAMRAVPTPAVGFSDLVTRAQGILQAQGLPVFHLAVRSLGESAVAMCTLRSAGDSITFSQVLVALRGETPTITSGQLGTPDDTYCFLAAACEGDNMLLTTHAQHAPELRGFTLHEALPRDPARLRAFANATVPRLRRTLDLFVPPLEPSSSEETGADVARLLLETPGAYVEAHMHLGTLTLRSLPGAEAELCWRGDTGIVCERFVAGHGRYCRERLEDVVALLLRTLGTQATSVNVCNHWATASVDPGGLCRALRGAALIDLRAASQEEWPRVQRHGQMFCDALSGTALMTPTMFVIM